MSNPYWSFPTIEPGHTRRDPFEAEFFTGEEGGDMGYARTDALVREAIQNALDARSDAGRGAPVFVRFAISADAQSLPQHLAKKYLGGLAQHLNAVGNEVVNKDTSVPSMSFLVYEDFNTRGLCGDPARTRDPAPDWDEREDFYWFWWNVGRSGKHGSDRGRWGLGKTVFHSTSRINGIFGLSVRETDNRQLLMGQVVTRMHVLDETEYSPEGFFHDTNKIAPLYQPCEDSAFLDQFRKDFGLRRKNEPGLSVVVPYRFDGIKAVDLLRSAIVHWFLPILRGDLVVELSGPDLPSTTLTAETIRDVANSLPWRGSRSEKKHQPPPFDLAEWALTQQVTGVTAELNLAGSSTVPEWSEDLFEPQLLTSLRQAFVARQRIAIRIPMTVERKVGGKVESCFEVFIEHDESLDKGEDHFVRAGMTISKISTINSVRGIRGLVIVNDEILSAFLGDTEGPAHEEWKTTERRPDKTYVKWQRRISFVKNSLSKVIGYLTPAPAGLDEDLLSEVFSIDDTKKPGKRPKKRRGTPKAATDSETPPPPPIERPPKWYRIVRTADGFRIRPSDQLVPPVGSLLAVAVGYDLPDGNPINSWSKFDFVFDNKPSNPVKFRGVGAKVIITGGNRFTVGIEKPEFIVEVAGFDPVRDLFVRAIDAGMVEGEAEFKDAARPDALSGLAPNSEGGAA